MPTMLFPLGRIVATPGAIQALDEAGVDGSMYVVFHATGDWGDVDLYDAKVNERSIREGLRILSAYTLPTGVKIWIITEADRSSTTILLPEEY